MGAGINSRFVSSQAQLYTLGQNPAVVNFYDGNLFTAGTTKYLAVYGGYSTAVSATDTITAVGRRYASYNGLLSKYIVKPGTNTLSGALTFTARKNGNDIAGTDIVIPAGSTAWAELSLADTVCTWTEHDEVGWKAVAAAGTGSAGNMHFGYVGKVTGPVS